MGLGISQEWDELLARGYPHLRRLVEGHPDDAKPQVWAAKALEELDPKRYFVDWPAAVARCFVRGYGASEIGIHGHEKRAAAAQNAGPIDEAEGRRLIAAYMAPEHYDRYDFLAYHALFLVEAMIGTPATVDAVLGEFEALADLEPKYSTRHTFAHALGFLIRRLPEKDRAKAVARVDALLAKHPGDDKKYVRDFLSYLFTGRKVLEASGRKLGLYCIHFVDDPALMREVAADSVTGWDAWYVVHGGEELIDALTAKSIKQLWKGYKERTIEQLGVLASPKAVAALKEFGKIKAFAKHVEAALARRGGKPATAASKPVAKKPVAKKPVVEKPVAKRPAQKR